MPPSKLSLPTPADDDNGWDIVGWSGGWLAFAEDDSVDDQTGVAIDTEHSADGLSWQAGGQIDWDGGGIGDVRVVEGPAGLLAYDFEGTVCGSVGNEDDLIATSLDGITWKPINVPVFREGDIQNVSGGSAGYIATGLGGVWTSSDAVSWHKAALTGRAFKGLDGIEDGVAFSGGYVIAGETYGPSSDGCGGGPAFLTPSLWWSPDGIAWARDAVPGTLPGSEAWMDVIRVNDHVLIAYESNGQGSDVSWASTNGRSWRKIPDVGLANGDCQLLFNGQRTVIICTGAWTDPDTIQVIRDDLTVPELTQTGDMPDPDHALGFTAFGPTGLLRMDDSGNTYVGIPVAG